MTRLHSLRTAAVLLVVQTLVVATATLAADIDPLDWPYWRGPEGNSISRETGLPTTIKPAGGDGSNLLWKKEEGAGRSTPIVMNGKLYTLVRDKPGGKEEGEKVICFDAATGDVLWENAFNVWSSDVPDTRVGWSSVVGDPETGNVFALGVCGYFQCINGVTGKTVWSIPMHERFGLLSTYGGRTNYPVVCDDLVILGAVITGWGDQATPAHRLMGFDKATGDVRWLTSTRLRPPDTTHSAPTLCVIKGQKLLITGSGDGWIYAFQPRTGKMVWEYRFSRRGINTSPTVVGDNIFVCHSEENPPPSTKMGAIASIYGGSDGDITPKGELWKELEMGGGKSSILHVDGKLYCPDDAGKMMVLDAKSGQPIGRKLSLGTMNFATPVYADGHLYHMEKQGRFYIIKLDPKKPAIAQPRPAATFGSNVEAWSSPVISHGRLYIQTTDMLYCFEDKEKEHGSTERPKIEQENDLAEDSKPAQLQIVPADVLLKPGDKQQFSVRLFNSKGQLLDAKAEATSYEASGDGSGGIDVDGNFIAADDAGHSAAYVTASVDDLKSKARIRVVPPLPWKFDFTGLKDAPITWVGARYRHVLRTVEGNELLVKITTIPLGTKSRAWFGPADMHDYTIQADVLSKKSDVAGKIAAMGVIAQGYKLAIETPDDAGGGVGAMKLVINSWDAHDHRLRSVKPFVAAADTWYTLKLKVANAGDKAVCQGKVWKRGEKEPAEWTLELTDTRPNKQGAPGMHCNATDAEIFIDNVLVAANDGK